MKKILLAAAFIAFGFLAAYSQSQDANLNEQITEIEKKVASAKAGIPAAEEKKYYAVLSDVENRKNSMKMMLKTPADKRDAEWKEKWQEHYNKAMEKLNKLN